MKRLDEETDLSILPIETLAPHIMYLKDGYPFQNGFKKAAKATDFKQFLKIEMFQKCCLYPLMQAVYDLK